MSGWLSTERGWWEEGMVWGQCATAVSGGEREGRAAWHARVAAAERNAMPTEQYKQQGERIASRYGSVGSRWGTAEPATVFVEPEEQCGGIAG